MRRGCERLPVFEQAAWRRVNDPDWQDGLLVSVSEAGLAILTGPQHSLLPGSRIRLRLQRRQRLQPVRVIRVDHLSGTMDLVAGEYASPTRTGGVGALEQQVRPASPNT